MALLRTAIDTLEPRRLMAGVTLTPDRTLHIDGGAGADSVIVQDMPGNRIGVVVTLDGKLRTYALKSNLVRRLAVSTMGGNDTVHVTTARIASAVIAAGTGHDRVYAEGNASLIDGGAGNDRITTLNTTGVGTNNLVGGLGSDRLTASGGDNVLDGSAGNDILYHAGNMPSFDTSLAAEPSNSLARSMVEANRQYESRATLLGGKGNDLFYAASDDRLYGNAGRDQFILQAAVPGLRRPVHRLDAQQEIFARVKTDSIEIAQISLF